MALNYLLLVSQPLQNPETRFCLRNLAEFIGKWAAERHQFPTTVIFFEREFIAQFNELDKIAPAVLREAKDYYGLQLEKGNTAIIFLGKDRISIPDGSGASSPDGYVNIIGPDDVLEGYVQIGEVADPPIVLKRESRFVYWNADDGLQIQHEYMHIILLRKQQRDRIDDHRQEKEHWLMYEKIPLYGLHTFGMIERIDDKYEVALLGQFPGINWNYLCQAHDSAW